MQPLLVVLLALSSSAQIDAHTIIERSVHANAQDWNAAPDYDRFERDRQPGAGTKTYEVDDPRFTVLPSGCDGWLGVASVAARARAAEAGGGVNPTEE